MGSKRNNALCREQLVLCRQENQARDDEIAELTAEVAILKERIEELEESNNEVLAPIAGLTLSMAQPCPEKDGAMIIAFRIVNDHYFYTPSQIYSWDAKSYPWDAAENVIWDDELWIAYGQGSTTSTAYIEQYSLAGSTASLESSYPIPISKANMFGFIRLASGKLLCAYQDTQVLDPSTNTTIYWSWTDSEGTWHDSDPLIIPGHKSAAGAICQHPHDDSVWLFFKPDSRHYMTAIRLVEDGEDVVLDTYVSEFISHEPVSMGGDGDIMGPQGEHPKLSAVAGNDRILIAYQNNTDYYFSTSPFVKGANITVLAVYYDWSREVVCVLDQWVERSQSISLALRDGEPLIACTIMDYTDEENYSVDELYACQWNGVDAFVNTYLGTMDSGSDSKIISSQYIAATMEDKMIHFYRR